MLSSSLKFGPGLWQLPNVSGAFKERCSCQHKRLIIIDIFFISGGNESLSDPLPRCHFCANKAVEKRWSGGASDHERDPRVVAPLASVVVLGRAAQKRVVARRCSQHNYSAGYVHEERPNGNSWFFFAVGQVGDHVAEVDVSPLALGYGDVEAKEHEAQDTEEMSPDVGCFIVHLEEGIQAQSR